MTNASSFAPGLVLDGRYRLEGLLGEGGMGTVWVAQQLTLGRRVAIKALRAGRSDGQSRLEREARLLASLHHPAIVQVYDFGRTQENLSYVVMELVQGTSLNAHLMQVGPMPCEEAVSLLLPLLEGLAAVHAAGIVHRDIKPANILLSSEARQGVIPKLLDFGIARNDEAAALTMDGTLVGTPAGRIKGSWSISMLIGRYISRSVPLMFVVRNLVWRLKSWRSTGTRPARTSAECRSAISPWLST